MHQHYVFDGDTLLLGQFWCNVMQWVDVVYGLALWRQGLSVVSNCCFKRGWVSAIDRAARTMNPSSTDRTTIGAIQVLRNAIFLEIGPPPTQCLIQDKISTSPSPTDRRAVVMPRGRARSSHWAIFLLNNIAITNNSTFPKIKLHYSISYGNKTKSKGLR